MTKLLTDKTLWVTLLTLVALILGTALPGVALDPEQWAAPIIIVVGYIAGVTIDPGAGPFYGSRKFWAAVVSLIFTGLATFHVVLPDTITPELLTWFAVTVSTFIVGLAKKDQDQLKAAGLR